MNLWSYIIRRLLYTIPIILGVCLIIFAIFNLTGYDPAAQLLGKHATAKQVAEVRRELGLDKPLAEQYFDIVKTAFTFDFGRSWTTKQKISDMIREGAGPSLTVTLPSFAISTVMAILISIVVAFYRGKFIDRFLVVKFVGMMSIPSLAYILFFQWFFAYKLGWFEISGFERSFPEFLPYVTLPIIIMVVLSIGPDVRYFRTVILDDIYQDYVRTARAKGLSETVVLLKHVLKNSMIPILTYVVIQIPFLILGALLIESFFSIPGLGGMTVKAVFDNDFPVIKAMTILSALAFILFQLLTDVLYTVVDPRVRLK
ncbi:ABC transporter permease [Bacteriovorax sp. Seq25_V]|uniref:ABC transporter permease n=1 Tax=Bacteriovorax sp. Seq25_V TaxID=1201288 RepID=UPI00038A19DA|nr:ABC transporter permease [Bacteriovorax sp. Seq25_V]EQC47242.1 ABC transporter, permease protein [Bacteriovorax sp. Seq25_V]